VTHKALALFLAGLSTVWHAAALPFYSQVRAAKTAQEEREVVQKECAAVGTSLVVSLLCIACV